MAVISERGGWNCAGLILMGSLSAEMGLFIKGSSAKIDPAYLKRSKYVGEKIYWAMVGLVDGCCDGYANVGCSSSCITC